MAACILRRPRKSLSKQQTHNHPHTSPLAMCPGNHCVADLFKNRKYGLMFAFCHEQKYCLKAENRSKAEPFSGVLEIFLLLLLEMDRQRVYKLVLGFLEEEGFSLSAAAFSKESSLNYVAGKHGELLALLDEHSELKRETVERPLQQQEHAELLALAPENEFCNEELVSFEVRQPLAPGGMLKHHPQPLCTSGTAHSEHHIVLYDV